MSIRLLLCTLICLLALILPIPAFAASTNCVWYLRSRGEEVPQNPKIWAKTLPVESTELPPEGKVALIVTYETPYQGFVTGHVRMAEAKDGKLYNVLDSINGTQSVEIDLALYKGYVYVKEVT